MEILHNIVSLILPLGLLIAFLYLMAKVHRIIAQLQKFEKLFRALREANTKTRFLISRANDKVVLLETAMQDLQSQIDIVLYKDGDSIKTEGNNDEHN